MISSRTFLVALCVACCALVALAATSKRDIVKIDPIQCRALPKEQTCLSCCEKGGYNGYDEKRSFGCLCIQFSGDVAEIASLSDVMKAEAAN